MSAWQGRSYDLGKMTMGELRRAYIRTPAIQVYLALAAICAAAVLRSGGDWVRILVAMGGTVVLYPFAWYALHRFVLHGTWLYRSRWTASLWKRIHFDHHQDPHRLEVLFGAPSNTLPTIALITVPLGYAVAGLPGGVAAFGAGLITTCVYEFCHCIQHLNYKPRNRLLHYLKKKHLLHHFHDEAGNYGIVSFLPDRIFDTFYPNATSRARSRHVFNLGYDLREARRYPWVMERSGGPPHDRPPAARTRRAILEP